MKLLVPVVLGVFVGALVMYFWSDEAEPPRTSEEQVQPAEGGREIDLEDAPSRTRDGAVAPTREVERVRPPSGLGDVDPRERHLSLSRTVLSAGADAEERRRARDELRRINAGAIFAGSRSILPHEVVTVASGDNLTRIAQRFRKRTGVDVTPAMIMRFNGKTSDVLRIGDRLAIPSGATAVVIRKSDFALYLLLGEHVVMDFPVGLGRDDSTPTGDFVIRGKTVDPDWTTPAGELIRFGEPGHLIGTRWMGFDDEHGRTGYGIHGTIEDASIGTQSSDGCVRLVKADVEELFRLVPEGATVKVRS